MTLLNFIPQNISDINSLWDTISNASLADIVFGGFCALMTPLCLLLGGYKVGMIYLCCYAWPAICTLATIPTVITGVMRSIKGQKRLLGIIVTIIAILALVISTALTQHFINRYPATTVDASFNRCMNDLIVMADSVGLSYSEINLLIYVAGFIIIVGFWLMLAYLVYPKKHTK